MSDVPGGTSGGIFLNYRSGEHKKTVQALHKALQNVFGLGRVFLDEFSIDLGTEYTFDLENRLQDANAVVAVVHPTWLRDLNVHKAARNWLVEELQLAKRRDIPVYPVLVDGAEFPGEQEFPPELRWLSQRQYRSVRSESDVDALVEELVTVVPERFEPAPPERARSSQPTIRAVLSASLSGLAALVLGLALSPLKPYRLLAASVLCLVVVAVLTGVMYAVARGTSRVEADLHLMPVESYLIRAGLPVGISGMVALGALIAVSSPLPVTAVTLGVGVIAFTIMVVSARQDGVRREEQRVRLWPQQLSTPVRPVALRREVALLEAQLAEHRGNHRRLPTRVRVRCAYALGSLAEGVDRLRSDARRSRARWALADHPVQSTGYLAWVAATVGLARGAWQLVAITLGLAAVTVELLYRQQRRVRVDAAAELDTHVTSLRKQWSDVNVTRS